MKTLYDMERSGNCYKVRLLLALLGESYQRIPVNLQAGENRHPDFLALNPRGEIPVLVDGEAVIWDSSAILIYLATRNTDAQSWYPSDALSRAQITQWMAVSGQEIQYGLAVARAIQVFGRAGDLKQCQALGQRALTLLENKLSEAEWLVGNTPTLADIACYPYVATADEGGIALAPNRNVVRWCRRIEQLPGYVPMLDSGTLTASGENA